MNLCRIFLTSCGLVAAFSAAASARTHVGVGFHLGPPAPVYVRHAPPPPVVERIIVNGPGPNYVWAPGRYTWTGAQWMWVGGAWMIPPAPDARWVNGAWNPQTQQWIDAHWELPAAAVTTPLPPPAAPPAPNLPPSSATVTESSAPAAAPSAPVAQPPPPPPAPPQAAPTAPAPVVVIPAAPPPGPAEIMVVEPPPPPAVETRTASPGPGYVWIPGYWGWENGQRQWFRGHWAQPPPGYRVWVAPRWERRANGYAFIRGYWM